jgi:hypothetical protein
VRSRRFPLHEAGALPISLSPMVACVGAVMEPRCASQFRSAWSILLTFKKIVEMSFGAEAAATILVGAGRKLNDRSKPRVRRCPSIGKSSD